MLQAVTCVQKRSVSAALAQPPVAEAAAACGMSGGDMNAGLFEVPEGTQIFDNGRILTFDDLAAVGF